MQNENILKFVKIEGMSLKFITNDNATVKSIEKVFHDEYGIASAKINIKHQGKKTVAIIFVSGGKMDVVKRKIEQNKSK